jgi:crotonobetainyl-CoA:carnitine CoA-transferase CaiB-like acyl-CoA transferase
VATALKDIRVLDLTDESGVFATRLLSDLGAEVIRVEAPDGGPLRNHGPFLDGVPGVERSYYHLFHNANKRSLALDIESDAGRQDFERLAASADVIVETSQPGAMGARGLSYEGLSAGNAGLIYVSITPFGQSGPWRDRKGGDLIAAASGGLLLPSGGVDDPPMQGNADPSFKMAALQAVAGTLIALRGRSQSGRGVHIDISLQEATTMAMVQQLNPNLYVREGHVPRRAGLHGPLFECLDGRWIGIRVRPDRFQRFLDWAEKEGVNTNLKRDSLPSLQAGGADINARADVTKTLGAVTTRISVEKALEIAWELDLIALPVGRFDQMAKQDHFVATRQFIPIHHAGLGRDLGFNRSAFDGLAGGVDIKPAPALGSTKLADLPARTPLSTGSPVRAPSPEGAKPLAGLRIIDFTWVLAGPFGTRILANFGAEVIKVESHARPDTIRAGVPAGAKSLDAGYMFNDANAGKKSLTLDLTRPEGRDLILRLAEKVDVVTNNYRPGALERMGLGYTELSRVKPDIIYVGLPGCGTEGPWSPRGTLGGVLMAASGLNDISGFEGRPPYGIATAFPDFTSPYFLASTVMAAVHERDRTGKGQEVQLNQLSATVGLLGAEWMRFAAEGSLPRNANRSANHCPHGVYRCRGEDEWVAIAVGTDDEWQRFCAVAGRPDLAARADFATLDGRKEREDDIDAAACEWARERDKWEAADQLQAAGIAAAAVESLADLVDRDPQLAHRAHYQRLRQPSEPDLELVVDGEAIHFMGEERPMQRAPMMGEHNEYVLRDILGLSEREFDDLVVAGVVN